MKIELGEDGYRIVDGDDAGDIADYEDVALFQTAGRIYAAFMSDTEAPWEGCEKKIYRLEPVATEVDEVEFEESDDDSGDDTDDGEGDDGEDED